MRATFWLILALACVTAGCNKQSARVTEMQERTELNTWMVDRFYEESIHNAIIRQRTIFPHYFDPATARLNELGERDVAILAAHLKDSPGTLNVRRGDADADLYQRRVDAVLTALARGGVDPNTIAVGQGLPIGDGVRGPRVLVLMEDVNQPTQIQAVSDGGSINTFTTTSGGIEQ